MVDKSEKFSWLVRLGYAARGVTYVLLGYIALSTAGEVQSGAAAVYDYLQEVPFGTPLLWLMAIGLLAYGLFKLFSAISDIQNRGDDAKGLLVRVGDGASAVAHFFLAFAAYQFANGTKNSAAGEGSGREMAGSVLSMELGAIVIGIIGIGFLVGAVMQAKKAWTGSFMHHISGRAPQGVRTAGKIGHAARAVVFLLIGLSMLEGAWLSSEGRVKGLGEAIVSLRDTGALYTAVAVGLVMFGVFSLVTARYRIIPDVDRQSLKPSLPG
ncbi:DUF1206 domain-containing protein [Parerythrobacter aurantius]|uniref:DUF1206 domain-containing protein n=1 Tax=Parerythrobacter aurantius TaxID=3127706 RepID=UPI0032477698